MTKPSMNTEAELGKDTGLEQKVDKIFSKVSLYTIILSSANSLVIAGVLVALYFMQGSIRTELVENFDARNEKIITDVATIIGDSSEELVTVVAETIVENNQEFRTEIGATIVESSGVIKAELATIFNASSEDIRNSLAVDQSQAIGLLRDEFQEDIRQLAELLITMNNDRQLFEQIVRDLQSTSTHFEEVGITLTQFNNQLVDVPFYVQGIHKGLFAGDSAVAPMVSNIDNRVGLATDKIDAITDQLNGISDRLPAAE